MKFLLLILILAACATPPPPPRSMDERAKDFCVNEVGENHFFCLVGFELCHNSRLVERMPPDMQRVCKNAQDFK